jgi:hypothetical protein
MKDFVEHILVPYLTKKKQSLGLPEGQRSLWQIDVWSVHRSLEFRTWMKAHHPNITMHYVPAGTTGQFQPCDVGIQRIFKHSLKRSYHEDLVNEILEQLDQDKEGAEIKIQKQLPVIRNRTVKWLWDAHQVLDHPGIVKKVSIATYLCLSCSDLPPGLRDVSCERIQSIV